MADGGTMQAHGSHATTVMHPLDGALLVFQRYDDLWMIDHIPAPPPSNARSHDDDDDGDTSEFDDEAALTASDGATSVAFDELVALDPSGRAAFHARQLRKLGLAPDSPGARMVWRLVQDPMRFAG